MSTTYFIVDKINWILSYLFLILNHSTYKLWFSVQTMLSSLNLLLVIVDINQIYLKDTFCFENKSRWYEQILKKNFKKKHTIQELL